MNAFKTLTVTFLLTSFFSYAQSISDIINQVDLNKMTLTLNEFTGEQPTVVNGVTQTIINRQQATNDVAANYLVERLNAMGNLTITDQAFNTNGRNIIAKQVGKTNPNNIYIISAHYDTVADYCADDNASGVAAVLEIARILSKQCLDNTIIYAFWDEEEIGLLGAEFYANQAEANGTNILGVLNIDMMGYDANNDNNFDIDVRDFANSLVMKDELVTILNNPAYGFNLIVNVVNPGTTLSDHSKFWNHGFTAVLVGESWETNDQSAYYHSSNDRFATLNLPYFHELTKFIMAYMVTKGQLLAVDNTVSITTTTLTSNQAMATYQWIDCTTNTPIAGETNQVFTPTVNGMYAVEVTTGTCTETSACIAFNSLGVSTFSIEEINVFPNPTKNVLTLINNLNENITLNLYDTFGKLLLQQESVLNTTVLDVSKLATGIYYLKIASVEKTGVYKIVKE